VALTFQPGSAILPEGAAASLRQLAATRAGRDIRVVGHGESPGQDAASQAAVLPLAFARARSMAAALTQAGVPAASLRVGAEATGRGGVARIAE
jgi:outer membrane protein OmpA-like peptidoglycan-associated protein